MIEGSIRNPALSFLKEPARLVDNKFKRLQYQQYSLRVKNRIIELPKKNKYIHFPSYNSG